MYSVCTTVCRLNIILSSSLCACEQDYLCPAVLSDILYFVICNVTLFFFSAKKCAKHLLETETYDIAFTRHMTEIQSSVNFF